MLELKSSSRVRRAKGHRIVVEMANEECEIEFKHKKMTTASELVAFP